MCKKLSFFCYDLIFVGDANAFIFIPAFMGHGFFVEGFEVVEFGFDVLLGVAEGDDVVADFGAEGSVAAIVYVNLFDLGVPEGVLGNELGELEGFAEAGVFDFEVIGGEDAEVAGDSEDAGGVFGGDIDAMALGVEVIGGVADVDNADEGLALGDFDVEVILGVDIDVGFFDEAVFFEYLFDFVGFDFAEGLAFDIVSEGFEDELFDVLGLDESEVVGIFYDFDMEVLDDAILFVTEGAEEEEGDDEEAEGPAEAFGNEPKAFGMNLHNWI